VVVVPFVVVMVVVAAVVLLVGAGVDADVFANLVVVVA